MQLSLMVIKRTKDAVRALGKEVVGGAVLAQVQLSGKRGDGQN